MDSFGHVDLIEEPSDLTQCVTIIFTLRQINFFLSDRAQESFRKGVLFQTALLRHTVVVLDPQNTPTLASALPVNGYNGLGPPLV